MTNKNDTHPVIAFLGSFGLAAVLLVILFLLTLAGTLEQNLGTPLFLVQKKYFDSFIGVHWLNLLGAHFPVPFPGGMAVMGLLSVNLVVGGLVRIRRSWSVAGVYIAHIGILFLLNAGLVRYLTAEEGSMTLFDGQRSDFIESSNDWEISIAQKLDDQGKVREYIIPQNLLHLRRNDARTFKREGLPFKLTVHDFLPNSRPVRASDGAGAVVDGVRLVSMPPPTDQQAVSIPGAYVTLEDDNGQVQETVLWGRQASSWVVRSDGKDYAIDLRRRRTYLPFTILLNHFQPTFHPRTRMPKSFVSRVTRFDKDNTKGQNVTISMNEPMRTRDFVVYQSGWGPPGAGPGDQLYSTFAIAKNPSDHWPEYACYIIAIGLLIHFMSKLSKYIGKQNRLAAKHAAKDAETGGQQREPALQGETS